MLVFANRIKTVRFVADFLRAQERKQQQQLEETKRREGKNKNRSKKNTSSSSPSSSLSSSKIETLHGDRTQPERDAALAAFRAGKVTVLVATDVAARGLDVSGLRHVVNYDFPSTLESYEHRVGRAGRDGRGGHVASFFGRPLAPLARGVADFLRRHGQGMDSNLVRLAEAYEEARERMMEGEEGAEGGRAAEEGEETEEEEEQEKKKRETGSVGGGRRRPRRRRHRTRGAAGPGSAKRGGSTMMRQLLLRLNRVAAATMLATMTRTTSAPRRLCSGFTERPLEQGWRRRRRERKSRKKRKRKRLFPGGCGKS